MIRIKLKVLNFSGDTSHKACVHTRLGDFVAAGVATSKYYSEISIDYVLSRLEVFLVPSAHNIYLLKFAINLIAEAQNKAKHICRFDGRRQSVSQEPLD